MQLKQQGDVIAIQNAEGEILARYRYDAWGECTITYDNDPDTEFNALGNISIATINPFRYRSYILFIQVSEAMCAIHRQAGRSQILQLLLLE